MFSKTGDKKIDKGFEFVDRVMNNKQEKVKTYQKAPEAKDLTREEFAFARVPKDSEGPGTPTADEGRIYYKDNTGVVWKFSTTSTI